MALELIHSKTVYGFNKEFETQLDYNNELKLKLSQNSLPIGQRVHLI